MHGVDVLSEIHRWMSRTPSKDDGCFILGDLQAVDERLPGLAALNSARLLSLIGENTAMTLRKRKLHRQEKTFPYDSRIA